MARTPEAIRAAVGLLATDDDVYSSIWAVSRGLREGLADDNEYARLVSRVAGLVRFDLAQGPVSDSLVAAGRDSPAVAASAAARLVGLGDADYAAFLAGGAWAGAAERCASLADSLLSSGDPARAAAGIRTLRVARGEHCMPDGKEVARAVAAALRSGAAFGPGGDVHCEAMEALLDLYPEDRSGIGPMIEDLALRRSATRPLLADRIADGPVFDGATALRYMDICIDGAGPDDASLHCVCSALAVLAAGEPAGVARRMAALAAAGSYRDTFGGRVMEELGRGGGGGAARPRTRPQKSCSPRCAGRAAAMSAGTCRPWSVTSRGMRARAGPPPRFRAAPGRDRPRPATAWRRLRSSRRGRPFGPRRRSRGRAARPPFTSYAGATWRGPRWRARGRAARLAFASRPRHAPRNRGGRG